MGGAGGGTRGAPDSMLYIYIYIYIILYVGSCVCILFMQLHPAASHQLRSFIHKGFMQSGRYDWTGSTWNGPSANFTPQNAAIIGNVAVEGNYILTVMVHKSPCYIMESVKGLIG